MPKADLFFSFDVMMVLSPSVHTSQLDYNLVTARHNQVAAPHNWWQHVTTGGSTSQRVAVRHNLVATRYFTAKQQPVTTNNQMAESLATKIPQFSFKNSKSTPRVSHVYYSHICKCSGVLCPWSHILQLSRYTQLTFYCLHTL